MLSMLRKPNFHLFFTFLLIIAFSGCDFIREHYGDGPVRSRTKGVKNGAIRSYWPDKTLRIENNYVNDTLQGVSKTYYRGGKLKTEISYKDNLRHGIAKQYYDNGPLRKEINYANGKKEGQSTFYYKDGRVFTKSRYVNNLKEGKEIKYFNTGEIKSEQDYKYDYPGKGLVEYNQRSTKLTDYAKIKFKLTDHGKSSGKYRLEMSFDKNVKSPKFYMAKLMEGKYLFDLLPKVRMEGKKGVIEGSIPLGGFVMDRLDIIGSYKTKYGNTYITTQRYNLAVDSGF